MTGGSSVEIFGNAEANSRIIFAPNAHVELKGSGRVRGAIVADRSPQAGIPVFSTLLLLTMSSRKCVDRVADREINSCGTGAKAYPICPCTPAPLAKSTYGKQKRPLQMQRPFFVFVRHIKASFFFHP